MKIIKEKDEGSSILKRKTILIVDTGSIKKRFIFQKLKKIGLKIVCVNKEKNWAAPYVDHWILSDTTNHRETISAIDLFIKENPDNKIDGVFNYRNIFRYL